jgi:hypothetical protein
VKTGEVDFHFPVLGFTPDLDIWSFPDRNTLTSCGPKTLKDSMQSGMELVDAAGRRWVVRSVRRTGRAEPLMLWLVSHLISTPQSRIEQELEPSEPLSLSEAKDRVCASLRAYPDYYGAEDENDPALEELIAEVRSANSFGEIPDLLGLDSFMAY